MRKYKTAQDWLKENPGVRALILQTPAGPSTLYKVSNLPNGRFALLGVIE